MRAWLEPVRRALQARTKPLRVFFRDDDAGWDDRGLLRLIALFEAHQLPIDLAVIPQALTPALADALLTRRSKGAAPLGLHQHGLIHWNREPSGRPCEFGPSRGYASIHADLRAGRDVLAGFFGSALDPIFTPPWNRCSVETARALVALEFRVLSRDQTAARFDLPGLRELPVTVDWFARRHGARLPVAGLGELLAEAIAGMDQVGIMLHHAVTDPEDFRNLAVLLAIIADHPRACPQLMMALVGEKAAVA